MAGFDDAGLYYSDRFFDGGNDSVESDRVGEYKQAKATFKSFLREFKMCDGVRQEPRFVYRDQLKRRYLIGEYWIEVNLTHLQAFNEDAATKLRERPNYFLTILEDAAKEVADEMTQPRGEGREQVQPVQVMLCSDENEQTIRSLKSAQVSHIVKLSGIVIGASQVRSKAVSLTIACTNCGHKQANIPLQAGFEGFAFPRQCANASQATGIANKCPLDPYAMVADECRCIDFQTLKLQELPEDVPHGEMPRHMQMFCDRYLTDGVAPGNRVTAIGVYSIKKVNQSGPQKQQQKQTFAGVRVPYIRVIGVQADTAGRASSAHRFTDAQIDAFRRFSTQPDVYERICASIAPSIWGAKDIKAAVACLLFGGSRKRLPDSLTRRGDINVLLLGDPGTAKSQLLKFVEKCAPIAVYTSGKGSSAAGLTAAVIRDPQSRGFVMEGGAMVLADGGVVCIDEFDKMREDDRVAIHEAMEQQTISIAKAGITTTLNSRCSVLAAANSVFGRWDDMKGEANIDFMPTILSRFDMIFIVKDEHDHRRDMTLAKHVIQVHVNAAAAAGGSGARQTAPSTDEPGENELSLDFLKRASAGQKLISHYVRMRNPGADEAAGGGGNGKRSHRSPIPITVRQLEAVVRIAESLAKMQLRPFATDVHVDESLRLFRVSTQAAAATGNLAGVEGFTTAQDQETLNRVERQVKQRFAIGTQVAEHAIIQDLSHQGYTQPTVLKVLAMMIRRGEIQHKYQRKMLFRIR